MRLNLSTSVISRLGSALGENKRKWERASLSPPMVPPCFRRRAHLRDLRDLRDLPRTCRHRRLAVQQLSSLAWKKIPHACKYVRGFAKQCLCSALHITLQEDGTGTQYTCTNKRQTEKHNCARQHH